MDTIFVKHVKDRSPAKQAGLQRGDRLIAVNGVPVKDKSYSEVVQLIVNSPDYLHILVVPKEEDVLQRFFAETAYNPASNQPTYSDIPNDRVSAQQFLTHHLGKDATGLQVDAISWRSLQQPYAQTHFTGLQRVAYDRGQRSADNLYSSDTRQQRPSNNYQQEIYAEICPNEYGPRAKSRAVPQVPLYRKMGRRASEGNTLSDRERYRPPDYPSLNSGALEEYNMKAAYKSSYDTGADMSSLGGGNCRLSSDVGRRESTSSMSSTADGSKESLAFFGSTSTLTGHETDDSAIMTRVRRSVQQKEEFLKMPVSTEEQAVRKEFYGRPKKLERQVWPPTEKEVLRNTKPAHQNVMRVKNDIESERDLVSQNQNGQQFVLSGGDYSLPLQKGATSPRERANAGMARVHEAETAPKGYDSLESANGPFVEESTCSDDRKMYPPGLQIVQKRAKDFESGRPLPEDDPSLGNKMNFSRSELARLSSKKLVPTVCARAQEYETRTGFEPRRDTSSTSTNTTSTTASAQKRIQRDSRSLDSSGSYASCSSISSVFNDVSKKLSGNVTISSGSKYLHCPPPAGYSEPPTDVSSNEPSKIQVRSNSAESWVGALDNDRNKETFKRISRQDATLPVRTKSNAEDKPVVVKRRPKNTNLSEDDRAMRRESYLKATEGGRMHIEMQLSDGGDVSPQVLRSGSISSNSSGSIDRDKVCISPTLEKRYSIIREGTLNCKILEIDGKRSTDRSWKQVFIVLKGPKLYLYKDRHHLSPVSTSDSVDQYLSSGVDMRTSVVRIADDYTKRKNVLRVSAVKPYRSEFLLQTESTDELADWVKVFSEQAAASTDAELEPDNSKQQAVPQLVPASTTIQVQGSHLSPQWNKPKVTSSRNRSPTGQSPVSKSRKPSQVIDPCISPKSKTWKGRMVKQFRKFNQGGNSLNSPSAPEGSTFGIPLEDCLPSHANVYLPKFVEYCTDIIDEKGLHTIGIYRVPGNNASITGLTEEINKIYDDLPSDDPRWHDLHVVSSLLKSYFRKMPDSLVTNHLYPYFIKADKIEDPKARMEELRRLVNCLPKHNYHTLKHIIGHLKRVADNSHMNKMEAKNLAIVFGPTIVRPEAENMENMVNHMTNQCKIVESLLTHADWFFPDNYSEDNIPVPVPAEVVEDFDSPQNQALLLHNISKYEAFKDTKEKNGALFTSIISAAQRKVKRKPHKGSSSLHDSKDEATSPTNLKIFPSQSFSSSDLKESSCVDGKVNEEIPTTVMEMEQNKQQTEKVPWFNYTTDKEDFLRRIENFKQETAAMLQLPRKTEISVNNIDTKAMSQLSSSACNVNQNQRLSTKPADLQLLTKTHSACNVFERHMGSNARNSLTTVDSGPYSLQYDDSYRKETHSSVSDSGHKNNNGVNGRGYRDGSEKRAGRSNLRKDNSAESVNGSGIDTSSGNMKKVKFETESDSQGTGSLDSLNKLQTDNESLLSTMTKLIDEKLKEEHKQSTSLAVVTSPVIEDSLEKRKKSIVDKENILQASDLYRNPSLHKSQFDNNNSYKKEEKDSKEKEVDTMAAESIPDNERHISKPFNTNNKLNQNASGSKLRRSESLNKPERTVSPMNKLKRSESLNKGDKLKRSDSLSKTEKTENNNNKRRELSLSNKRLKDSTKNKRKNGMPDRSIKRRHTVGGTKDPDKITWLLDNKNQEEVQPDSENVKEKNLRTSSPDLSSTRRDRFFFEINLIGPENMVVALRQHLIGSSARPQSFPESSVFKVPLESHV